MVIFFCGLSQRVQALLENEFRVEDGEGIDGVASGLRCPKNTKIIGVNRSRQFDLV